MPHFDHIMRCMEVTDEDIAWALAPAKVLDQPGPRQKVTALIQRMVKIARPGTGAPKVLLVAAHMATCDWLEGDLTVKLLGDEELTVIELMVDDGLSLERIAAPMKADVPLAEFAGAIWSRPDVVLPLKLVSGGAGGRMILRADPELRRRTRPPAFSEAALETLSARDLASPAMPKIISEPPGPAEAVPSGEEQIDPDELDDAW